MNYLVADLVIRMKNACLARKKDVTLPYSQVNKAIGEVLVKQGFLSSVKEEEASGKKTLVATIPYEQRMPRLVDVEVISKPSLRVYATAKNISKLGKRGQRTMVVSTSSGVMTGKDAQKKGVGGEILFAIW